MLCPPLSLVALVVHARRKEREGELLFILVILGCHCKNVKGRAGGGRAAGGAAGRAGEGARAGGPEEEEK